MERLDTIEFGAGVKADDLSFSSDGNDLIIHYTEQDSIRIKDAYTNGVRYIEKLSFNNGASILNLNDLMYSKLGSNESETLRGMITDDKINAYGGDDKVYGWSGNDTLSGGDGNDELYGGDNDDTLLGDGGRISFMERSVMM